MIDQNLIDTWDLHDGEVSLLERLCQDFGVQPDRLDNLVSLAREHNTVLTYTNLKKAIAESAKPEMEKIRREIMSSEFSEAKTKVEQQLVEARRKLEEAKALYLFQQRHSEVRWCEAAEKIIQDFFNGDPITLESLEWAYANSDLKNHLKGLIPEEPTRRRQLAEQILELAKTQMSPESFEGFERIFLGHQEPGSMERKSGRIQRMTTGQLLEELNAMKQKAEAQAQLGKKTKEELREIVRAANPYQDFPFLPTGFGFSKYEILSMSAESLRKLVKKYGNKNVNARLNEAE